MPTITRRCFLTSTAVTLSGAASLSRILRAAEKSPALKSQSRVVDIERHAILAPFHEFNAKALYRCQGLENNYRTVFVVKTENGTEGYGESWGRSWPSEEALKKYIGSRPFDWVGDTENLPLNMAMYDLMGKLLGLPAHRLIGQKVRDWIPVAAWTVAQPPQDMAEEVRQAAGRGYHWLKFHVDESQDVVDQTAAMQKVAPPGFRVHYDFNANGNFEQVFPVLKELERFPIAARVEDPFPVHDRDAYRRLREKSKLSILIHHGPPKVMSDGLCDGYMAGHAPISHAAKTATIAEAANVPFMLQQAGGTINQAFLAHEVAVFKMATIDNVNLANLWKEDVTTQTMPVVNGSVRVPAGPGLGVELDREKLERFKATPPPKPKRLLARMRYRNGHTVYFRHDPLRPDTPNRVRFIGHVNAPGPPPGYHNHVVTDFWEEDGTASFDKIWAATAKSAYWENK